MPEVSGVLTCACQVARYIDHVIHWRIQFSFMLGFFCPWGSLCHFLLPSPSFLFLCCYCSLFSPLVFSTVRGACSFRLVQGSWLGCAVVSVMGALFQSRGWLPIVEAPRYSRHPTSILAMQLKLHFILSISNITVNVKTQRPGLLVRWLFRTTDILEIKTVGLI